MNTTRTTRTRLNLVVVCFTASLIASAASATINAWTGVAGDGLWVTPSNWSLGHAPNDTDDVVIATPGGDYITIQGSTTAKCKTLVSTHPVQIISGATLTIMEQADFDGGLALFSLNQYPPIINNKGVTRVAQFFNAFDCFINQTDDSTFMIKEGCNATAWGGTTYGFVVAGGQFNNFGTLILKSQLTLSAFSGQSSLNFVNEPNATLTLDAPAGRLGAVQVEQDHPISFVNYSHFNVNVDSSIDGKIQTYSVGEFNLNGADLSVPQLLNVSDDGKLNQGSWYLNNGAQLTTERPVINTVQAATHVGIFGTDGRGTSGSMSGLERAEQIYGSISVDGGASFNLAPAFFGTVHNHGVLSSGPGATMTVYGNYICHTDGTHNIIVADASPTGLGKFQSYLGMVLQGTLQVDFYDDTLLSVPGNSFVVANLIDPSCCLLEGEFANLATFPPTGDPSYVEYGVGVATLIAGVGPTCPADLDGDNTVGGADLATLLSQWGTSGAADLDGNGVVNGADLATLLSAWGSC